ncbi:hypothetical protein CQW23_30457 [Capsicum baccatum]|uniref:Cystatin domain-containing protein n=1 Tax=Capsicum baccatum TaxID=33114 RepID=A0A2G2VAM5_CAPBA|nr:hypothetical protein CQW23_30457 [Capsicum baccatum]
MPRDILYLFTGECPEVICTRKTSAMKARGIGSEQPIKPNDPKVVGIAKFAVQERNKEAKTNFKLVKVNAGGTDPIPDGVVYQLYISVTEATKRVLISEQPIKPNDPKVVGIAKFAVQQRNKEAKTNFKLVKVNAGGTDPIPDGVVYQLSINVTESSVSTTRLVFVLVHKDNTKELLAFE